MQIIKTGLVVVAAVAAPLAFLMTGQVLKPASESRPVSTVVVTRPAETSPYEKQAKASVSKSSSRAKPGETVLLPPPAQDDNPQIMVQRIDAYFDSLKTAAYTFNPPSPIQVSKPVTVHFWLDPQATPAALAEELKKRVPHDAAQVEFGNTKWSPKMRASLIGSQDFEVKAVDPEEQLVSSTQRTTWSWDIIPLHPGEKLLLHLRLAVVLPPELGPPKTVTTIDREINVEVTWWWLFDHNFEKYWKWLLGGLGGVIASVVAWWWKSKHTPNGNSRQHKQQK